MTDGPRPFSALRHSGLLWLINAAVLHPRGYALALHYPHSDADEPDGFLIEGDGSEPWTFPDTPDVHDAFRRVEHTLPHRAEEPA